MPMPVDPPGTTDDPVLEEDIIPLRAPREGVPPLVADPVSLATATARLTRGTGPISVDAERASGFRYGQDAYLVQLRREGCGTILIDPVTCGGTEGLAQALDGPEWILHAADQDLPCLAELGLAPASLFDTELAARLLGRQHVGLGAVVEETLGLRLAKDHAAADWSVRPLPESWLVYAALDVELLADLREALGEELASVGKDEWAAQEFEHLRTRPPKPAKTDPWRKTPRAGKAVRSPRSLAVLRELWTVREEIAKEEDRTPSKVLPHAALIAASLARPTSRKKLASLREFSSRQARLHQEEWWQAVERALALPDSELPAPHAQLAPGELPQPRSWARHHADAAEMLALVRQTVRDRADELRLPQELLLSPDTQRHLAWELGRAGERHPSRMTVQEVLESHHARPWQVEQSAQALSDALA
ncbi:HRDC domain-containing protein [Actinomyces trachealis]|uniref:HRDC domain-containing protein n=1 Tax=Actinomyces trachealis TaxID=2763540 RepID=UPI001FD54817|nr:HRDC domain-containing protein [Actinomyces trachealis]